MVKEKITICRGIYADANQSGYLNVHWFNKQFSGSQSKYNVGFAQPDVVDNTQFRDMMRNYTYYYPYGLSVKLMPRQFG